MFGNFCIFWHHHLSSLPSPDLCALAIKLSVHWVILAYEDLINHKWDKIMLDGVFKAVIISRALIFDMIMLKYENFYAVFGAVPKLCCSSKS